MKRQRRREADQGRELLQLGQPRRKLQLLQLRLEKTIAGVKIRSVGKWLWLHLQHGKKGPRIKKASAGDVFFDTVNKNDARPTIDPEIFKLPEERIVLEWVRCGQFETVNCNCCSIPTNHRCLIEFPNSISLWPEREFF